MSERIGVMGAGVMGSGIAQVLAISGHEVVCRDIDDEVLVAAREGVDTGRFGVRGAVERGKLSTEEADAALDRLTFTTDLEVAVDVDLIIEAIPEKLGLKVKFWRDLDGLAPADTIFASNSSGFPIAAMAAGTDRPDRFIGWHWASPAPVMKLAEIVRGPETSDATVDMVVRLAAAAGKNPVVVKDTDQSWGYVANRVYFAMVREANRVVAEGIADREQVDQLMRDCFRWPSGPYGMVAGAGVGLVLMAWLSWIVPGLIVGFIARIIVPTGRRFGCLGTILLGVAGSFMGGLIASLMADGEFDLTRTSSWIGATVGAIVILLVLRLSESRRPG